MIIEQFADVEIEQSQRGKTENQAETYVTSDGPRIGFFFKLLEDTDENGTISLLERSWNYNGLDSLRLIAYLRDIRNGKGIKFQYYVCLYWMYKHHPQTLLHNFSILPKCGYWKDPLQLLIIILFKGKIPKYLFQEESNADAGGVNKKIKTKKDLTKTAENPQREVVNKIKKDFYETVHCDINEVLIQYYKQEINEKYRPLLKRKINEAELVRERKVHEIDKKHL